eukprot:gene32809-40495_t
MIQSDVAKYSDLRTQLLDVVAKRLRDDEQYLENPVKDGSQKMSLCSKYVPREGKKFAKGVNDSIYTDLRKKLFPDQGCLSRVLYRKLIVKLTKALDVPEIKMCAKRYRELSFVTMPSVCANKFRKAFLNEKLKEPPSAGEIETGNRFPEDTDRIQCREHLRSAIKDKAVKGKQLYPHEIVTQLNGTKRTSTAETDMLDVQWADIRNNLVAKLAELSANSITPAINVGKLVPLVDVSGSMNGIPMEVAIALGILVSEVNHPSFRDRLITFHENPSWVNLSSLATIGEKVALTRRAPWGGSTNIEKAFQLILKIVIENKLPVEEVPDLIIFSDMQFNMAVGYSGYGASASSQTQLEQIKELFHDAAMKICGTPYPPPKIIFWNLRGDTHGFPAQAESENVQMLSGYSPSLLKFVLEGEALLVEEEVIEVNEEGEEVVTKTTRKANPYDTLRKVLDDSRYDAIRSVLSASEEGMLVDYHFTPPEPVVVVEKVAEDGVMHVEDVEVV